MTGEFDVRGPLPTGVTVLEASAGTGKTYTIAALAARYVAAGTPLRAAPARDLHAPGHRRAARARPRAAVVRERACAGPTPDAAHRRRHGRRAGGVALRRGLTRALADFDAATIATTHGFCQEALRRPRVSPATSSTTPSSSRTPRPARRRRRRPLRPPFRTATGERRVHPRGGRPDRVVAVANPLAPIEPADADESSGRRCARGWPTPSGASSTAASSAPAS